MYKSAGETTVTTTTKTIFIFEYKMALIFSLELWLSLSAFLYILSFEIRRYSVEHSTGSFFLDRFRTVPSEQNSHTRTVPYTTVKMKPEHVLSTTKIRDGYETGTRRVREKVPETSRTAGCTWNASLFSLSLRRMRPRFAIHSVRSFSCVVGGLF